MPSLNSIRLLLVLNPDRTIQLSDLAVSDARTIATVHKRSFAQPWTAADFTRFARADECHGVVARISDTVAGFIVISVAAGDAEILTLAVDPIWRRHGVASTILARAMADAAGRGAATMFLEVGVTNGGARALYKQLGFARAGRRPAYYSTPNGPEDAIVMKRNLLEALPVIDPTLTTQPLSATGNE